MDFSETIAACDLKVGKCTQLIVFMKVCEYDLFYGKVKFGNLGISIGKRENSGYFRNYCSQWPEIL